MKVLFFGINYHTYTRDLIHEMTLLGAQVTFVDIQPRSLALKTFRTISGALYNAYVQKYLLNAVERLRSTLFDKVIFLQVHQMEMGVLSELRRSQSQAEFTLYNWDAISTHDYLEHTELFDRVLTFDRSDATVHNFGYLPLFCSRQFQEMPRDKELLNSAYMVGNIVRLERYHAVEAFREYCIREGILFQHHLKISPVVLSHAVYANIWPRNVSARSISPNAFISMMETSAAAFDFANHSQSGQTMRMMESICAGKKVITNNARVKEEPIYSPDRIHVFTGLDFSGVSEFLQTPISDPDERFRQFHIQAFTRYFLGLERVATFGGRYV